MIRQSSFARLLQRFARRDDGAVAIIVAVVALLAGVFVRFGRQNLVWGETDVFRLLDNINPTDSSFGGFFIDSGQAGVPANQGSNSTWTPPGVRSRNVAWPNQEMRSGDTGG